MSTWKNVQGSQRYKYRSRTINAYCSCVMEHYQNAIAAWIVIAPYSYCKLFRQSLKKLAVAIVERWQL